MNHQQRLNATSWICLNFSFTELQHWFRVWGWIMKLKVDPPFSLHCVLWDVWSSRREIRTRVLAVVNVCYCVRSLTPLRMIVHTILTTALNLSVRNRPNSDVLASLSGSKSRSEWQRNHNRVKLAWMGVEVSLAWENPKTSTVSLTSFLNCLLPGCSLKVCHLILR